MCNPGGGSWKWTRWRGCSGVFEDHFGSRNNEYTLLAFLNCSNKNVDVLISSTPPQPQPFNFLPRLRIPFPPLLFRTIHFVDPLLTLLLLL